jgi:pimeloyl-ACP methyl ester carboxylesterase
MSPKNKQSQSLFAPKSTIGRFIFESLRVFMRAAAAVSPRLAAQAALALFLKPPKPQRPAWEEKVLASARRFDLEVNAHRIALWTWGDLQGKIALLVHGWGGRGSQLGAFVEPLRAAGYSVVAFDAPGHGDSSGRLSSLPLIEEALAGVAENIGPVDALIAHSAGAAVAQAALARGLETDKLVFLAPGVDPFEYIRYFGRAFGLGEEVLELMSQGIEERYGVPVADYYALRRAGSQLTPLLVAHDVTDLETPYEAARELAEAWPTASFLRTEGLGHRRILREGAVIGAALRFLEKPGFGSGYLAATG